MGRSGASRLFEQGAEFFTAGDVLAFGSVAEVGEDGGGGGVADVAGEQGRFEVVEHGLVDGTGDGEDGLELVGEGFPGAGDGLLHAGEEAGGGLLGIGSGRGGDWGYFRRRGLLREKRRFQRRRNLRGSFRLTRRGLGSLVNGGLFLSEESRKHGWSEIESSSRGLAVAAVEHVADDAASFGVDLGCAFAVEGL